MNSAPQTLKYSTNIYELSVWNNKKVKKRIIKFKIETYNITNKLEPMNGAQRGIAILVEK